MRTKSVSASAAGISFGYTGEVNDVRIGRFHEVSRSGEAENFSIGRSRDGKLMIDWAIASHNLQQAGIKKAGNIGHVSFEPTDDGFIYEYDPKEAGPLPFLGGGLCLPEQLTLVATEA